MKGQYTQSEKSKTKRKIWWEQRNNEVYRHRYEFILNYIALVGSIKVVDIHKLLKEGKTKGLGARLIKRMVFDRYIKLQYFGINDVRYVFPNFSFEKIIKEYMLRAGNMLMLSEIMEYLKICFGVHPCKMSILVRQLVSKKEIKNTRGYRKNYYSVIV